MNLNINDFNGPLDVLLHMVKKHEMDIYEVDIKIIIEEYIEFIESLDKFDIDSKSEYLVMASELIHLKSKMLLGFEDDAEEDTYEITSEEDLRQRLIEYEKYQNITNDFRALELNRQDYFTKIPESLKEYQIQKDNVNEQIDIKELINAMLELQQRNEYKKPKTTKVTKKELSIKDKTYFIRDILKNKKRVEISELVCDISKEELIITILSILEMTKNNEVSLSQKQNFSKIFIEVLHE